MSCPEDNFVQKYFAPLSANVPGAQGLKDDVALIDMSGDAQRIFSSDMLIAGVHFYEDDAPRDIAWKCLAVNISDIVASGGAADYYLLSIALNKDIDESWIKAFSEGLGVAQSAFGVELVGGDTTRSDGPLTVSITAMGTVPTGGYRARSGGRPGDLIFVTGEIGNSHIGCRLRGDPSLAAALGVSASDVDYFTAQYLRPSPRLEMVAPMRDFASAAMDISDGLVLDLGRLLGASGCGANINVEDVPLGAAARRLVVADAKSPKFLKDLLTGGDDYELLILVPSDNEQAFLRSVAGFQYSATRIGMCTDEGDGVFWRMGSEELISFERPGYDHLIRG